MTDNEIIKALECCCGDDGCFGCPYTENHSCRLLRNPIKDALDLINRQKAEIERLKENNRVLQYCNQVNISSTAELHDRLRTAKAEAIKEFAENAVDRVEKARLKYQRLCKEQGEEMEEHMHIHFNGIMKIIKDIEKEMVGDV